MKTREEAIAVFREGARDDVVAAADRLVETDAAYWTADPYVDGVYGLIRVDGGKAAVVVYPDGDFEVDRELEETSPNV